MNDPSGFPSTSRFRGVALRPTVQDVSAAAAAAADAAAHLLADWAQAPARRVKPSGL